MQERARGCSDGALILSMRQVGNDRPDLGRRGDADANRGLGAIPPSPRALRSVIISHIAPDIDRIRPFTPLHQRNPGSIRNVTQEASFFS